MKSRGKVLQRMFAVIIMFFVIVSISPNGLMQVSAGIVKPTKVILNYDTYPISMGKTATLKATVMPKNAANMALVWMSSDNKIVKVSSKGVITGIAEGRAIITVTVKGTNIKALATITVKAVVPKLSAENKGSGVNDEKAKPKAEADAKEKAEADARAKAEADAKAKIEAEAKVKAQFTNRFLEKWVRKYLKMSDTQEITIGDLDKITTIKFAAGVDVTDDQNDSSYGYYMYGGYQGVSAYAIKGCTIAYNFYDLTDLKQFRQLDTLVIAGDQVTDITPLQGLPLVKLDLSRCHVTDIAPLGKITTLRQLNLQGNPVSNVKPLSTLDNLQRLNLYDTDVKDISALKNLNLQELNVGYTQIEDLSIVNYMNLNSLLTVGCSCKDYSFIESNQSLAFWQTSTISDKIAKYISKSNLKQLFLCNCSDGDLTDLGSENLERIYIWDSSFNSLDFLKNCTGVTYLQLCRIKATDISVLKKMTKLNEINITSTQTTDISSLKSLPELSTVTLPAATKDCYLGFKNEVTWIPSFDEGVYTNAYTLMPRFPLSGTPEPKPSQLAFEDPSYIAISKVGTFDKGIITDKILSTNSNLPEASNQKLPYWKGVYTTEKLYKSGPYGSTCWTKEEIKFLADQGMNYVRIIYDFSYLSNPKNVEEVDETELKRIDELISWGIEYGVHIDLAMIGLPGMDGESGDKDNIGHSGGIFYFSSVNEQLIVKNYWTMLSRRYADIPNKYLSFDLYAEPNFYSAGEGVFSKVTIDLANAIWQADGNKSDSKKRIAEVEAGSIDPEVEAIVKAGCPLALHNSGVHRLAVGSGLTGFYQDYPYLPQNDIWPVYLQEVIWNQYSGNNVLAINAGTGTSFQKGTKVSIYIKNNTGAKMGIYADGTNIYDVKGLEQWRYDKDNTYSITLTSDTAKLEVKNESDDGDIYFYLITITRPGEKPINLVPHTFGNIIPINEPCATLTIDKTGKVVSNRTIDADWYYDTQVLPFVELTKKYNVGFMLGELQVDLSVSSDIAYDYEEMLLKKLNANQIGWCDCQSLLLQIRSGGIPVNYEGTPWFYDKKMWDAIKKYLN